MVKLDSIRQGKVLVPGFTKITIEIYKYINYGLFNNKIYLKNLSHYYDLCISDTEQTSSTGSWLQSWLKWKVFPKEEKCIYLLNNNSKLYLYNPNIDDIYIEIVQCYDTDIREKGDLNINYINDGQVNKPCDECFASEQIIGTRWYEYSLTLSYNSRKLVISSKNGFYYDKFYVIIGFGTRIYNPCNKPLIIDNLYLPRYTVIYFACETLNDTIYINEFFSLINST